MTDHPTPCADPRSAMHTGVGDPPPAPAAAAAGHPKPTWKELQECLDEEIQRLCCCVASQHAAVEHSACCLAKQRCELESACLRLCHLKETREKLFGPLIPF